MNTKRAFAYQKGSNNLYVEVNVLDLDSDFIDFECPIKSIDVGFDVTLKINLKIFDVDLNLIFKGKIIGEEYLDDSILYSLEVKQYSKDQYEYYVSLLSDRQDEIFNFLERVRGF